MGTAPNENLLQVDPVDVGGERRTVLKPLNSVAIAQAINNLKAKIDPNKHEEVDAAVNQAMARFIDRKYTFAFAQTIAPLDDALKSAVAGETSRLASALGLSHITREGAQAQIQNLNQIGTARIGEAQELAQAQARVQAEAARIAREKAEAARLAQVQTEAASSAAGRREALLDTLGGKKGTSNPPNTVAKKP